MGDAEAYRTKEAVATWKLRDPITRFESWLVAHQEASAEQLGLVWIDVESQIDNAVDFAEASPEPAGPTALHSLYAESVAAWAR